MGAQTWTAIGLALDAIGAGVLLTGVLTMTDEKVGEMAQSYMLGSEDLDVLLKRPVGRPLMADRKRARVALPMLFVGFVCQFIGSLSV